MTISTDFWAWPQWVLLGWVLLGLIIHSAEHGKPRKPGTNNAFAAYLLRTAILLFILAAGGFFK